jgi:hypothetical protein
MQEETVAATGTGEGNTERKGAATVTRCKWSEDGENETVTDTYMEALNTPTTSNGAAMQEGLDKTASDIPKRANATELKRRPEKHETQVDPPMKREGVTYAQGVRPRGGSPPRRREGAGETSEYEDGTKTDKADPPAPEEPERTQEEIRRAPKRTKKMKLDKNGEQQPERSRSLPRKATV